MTRARPKPRVWCQLVILCFMALCGAAPAVEPVTVTVTVNGIRSLQGSVDVCLWREAGEFPLCQPGTHALHRRVPITGTSMVIRFDDVPPGSYAVAAHHDEDGDGKFGRNFIGMPTEGVGIAGRGSGRPDYRSAILSIAASKDLVIDLRYLDGARKSRPP